MQTRLEPQKDHRQGQHGREIDGPLLIAGSNPAKLFQPVDQTLHFVALAIDLLVKRRITGLIAPSGDGVANAFLMQEPPKGAKTVAFIARQAVGIQAFLATGTTNGTLLEQRFCLGNLMPLARGEEEGDGFALSFTA